MTKEITKTDDQQFIDVNINKQIKPFTFVDLGSGDGRVVLYASSQMMDYQQKDNNDLKIPLFDACVGYEINPLLHLYAKFRSIIMHLFGFPNLANTNSYLQNIWTVPLQHVDVVAVVRSLSAFECML